MVTEHIIYPFFSKRLLFLNWIRCHDSGLLGKWIGADQKSRSYLETLFRQTMLKQFIAFHFVLTKSNLNTQATRVCRLVYHESQFKTFLSPNTLLKVRTDSPACFLVLFSQTACSQFWMEGLMHLSWSFATFCYCCLHNGLKGHIMLWKYLTSEWRFLNTLPILFFLCSIFRGVCLMVARNDLDFNRWT